MDTVDDIGETSSLDICKKRNSLRCTPIPTPFADNFFFYKWIVCCSLFVVEKAIERLK